MPLISGGGGGSIVVAGIFLNEGVFGSLGSCPRVLKGSRGFVTRVINNPTYVPPHYGT